MTIPQDLCKALTWEKGGGGVGHGCTWVITHDDDDDDKHEDVSLPPRIRIEVGVDLFCLHSHSTLTLIEFVGDPICLHSLLTVTHTF
jgi:hypothetical protein